MKVFIINRITWTVQGRIGYRKTITEEKEYKVCIVVSIDTSERNQKGIDPFSQELLMQMYYYSSNSSF